MDSNERKIVQELVTAMGCVIPASDGYEPKTNLWNKYSAAKNLLAAAPKVVADERAAFEVAVLDTGFSPDAIKHDEKGIYYQMDVWMMRQGWLAGRAAAPVQAQEELRATLIELSHVQRQLIDANATIAAGIINGTVQAQEPVAYADPKAFVNFKAGACTNEWMWAKPDAGLEPLFRAPVQPVAVPDGWRIVEKATHYALISGNTVVASLAGPEAKENAAILARVLAAPAAQGDAETDMFLRGVIAALGALAPHCQHGDVIHDEIVRSVGKEALYRAAELEDVVWAGLDPELYAAIAAKAAS